MRIGRERQFAELAGGVAPKAKGRRGRKPGRQPAKAEAKPAQSPGRLAKAKPAAKARAARAAKRRAAKGDRDDCRKPDNERAIMTGKVDQSTPASPEAAPPAAIPMDARIYVIRGERVMLDSDLAEVYGVETGALNRAVDRNQERFPDEFAFRLRDEEWQILKCQIGTSSSWGGRRSSPRVFTEYGATALSMILNSDQAVAASKQIIRAFVRLRRVLDANRELARRIDELNARFEKRTGEDNLRFQAIFKELKRLALGYDSDTAKPKERIGFRPNKERGTEGDGRQQGQAKRKRG